MGGRAPGPVDVVAGPAQQGRGLADRLAAEGRITAEQHEAAIALQRRQGGQIEDALVESEAIAEVELLKYVAALHKTRFVSTERLSRADIDRATLDRVPRRVAERWSVVPVVFEAEKASLSIVTADPENVDLLDQVRKGAGVREVRALVARPAAIRAAIAKLYRGQALAFSALERAAARPPAGLELAVAPAGPPLAVHGPAIERERPALLGPSPPREPVAAGDWATSDAFVETLNVLVTLLENGREGLSGHSAHVARLVRRMCERSGVTPSEQNAVVVAAYLHDLGKTNAYHLTALNVAQHDAPRAAAEKSYATPVRLMSGVKLAPATIAALTGLYERHDGAGFPGAMKGRDIPFGARLVAIADTFVDLLENAQNSFQKRLAPAEACEVLSRHAGAVFDPRLTEAFRAMVLGDDLRARLLSNRRAALLIDPDPEETTVLELRMIEEGFDVRVARSIEQAREILSKGGIEIVVSELDLAPEWAVRKAAGTGGDGLALLSEARQAPWGRDLPWLVLTRRQERDDARRCIELSALDYVVKPAVTEVLVAKLKKAFEQRAAPAAARGVSGSLDEMSVPDLVQILWHGRKSGALRIRRGADAGEVHFVDGKVVHALWGKLRGADAFYAMLARLDGGEFALDPNFRPSEITIEDSPESLLLEGMRRLDES